ncbi:MAG: phosphoribosylformylglycinamidine cyclo-ligase [Spirochaetales bacterium]|nr:phosphoribosylformylglycinamidine cyclo-ligase [Spirochaetales bacterium]
MGIHSYAEAGVDIEKGDRFARFISRFPSPAVAPGIGGFAGGVPLDLSGYREPVLFSCTDGVGTKLLVAQELKQYGTLGIDLVAMSANDLAVCGVMPLVFLDYIGAGRLNEAILQEVVRGIVKGCEQAGCLLAGGETAEMPDMYDNDEFDLAGFCAGVGEKTLLLPQKEKIKPGDLILGIASSGIHSTGLSLARKVLPKTPGVYQELLTPTRIYVSEIKVLLAAGGVKGMAHITGGGLTGNFKRILPPGLAPRFYHNWPVPEIFKKIQAQGISFEEMERVFNLGIGIALAVSPEDGDRLTRSAASAPVPFSLLPIGEIILG